MDERYDEDYRPRRRAWCAECGRAIPLYQYRCSECLADALAQERAEEELALERAAELAEQQAAEDTAA